jgi:hypothetical protein
VWLAPDSSVYWIDIHFNILFINLQMNNRMSSDQNDIDDGFDYDAALYEAIVNEKNVNVS